MIETSLIGRTFKQYGFGGADAVLQTIVGVFLDRGDVHIIAENPEGGLWSTGFTSIKLDKLEELDSDSDGDSDDSLD